MAIALQCPACGFRHRLDAVGTNAVFPCSQCSRQLKLPAEYRDGAAAQKVASAGSADSDGSGVASPPSGVRRLGMVGRSRMTEGQVRVPLRILAWVIAFVLGAIVVRMLAKWTSFVDANTLVDLMLSNNLSTYLRLALLIPVWAFFATVIATVFLEAPRWWMRHNASARLAGPGAAGTVPKKPATPQAARPAAAVRPGLASEVAAGERARRVPPRSAPTTATTATTSTPTTNLPAGGDRSEAPARPVLDQRPRRIPRRDTGS